MLYDPCIPKLDLRLNLLQKLTWDSQYFVPLETLGVSVMEWDLRPSVPVVVLDDRNLLALILAFTEQAWDRVIMA